jgi:tape measure domain-containing protein
MLQLQDAFSRPIDKSISAMNKMVDAMETLNRTAQVPNAEKTFAEIRTEINLASHAVDELNADLNETGNASRSVSRLSTNFGALSRAIIVVNQGLQLTRSLYQGVTQIGDRADERISVDARLGLINDGLQTQAQLEAKVLAVANSTRSQYETTADLVAQMGRQDYFKGNNDKAIQFAATLNKGLVVSGASATEAAGAITQLSQGLASGVLRGDEFNSIMENAPILAEMMTKSMGITKGQLRSMAEDGKLTTDVVVSGIMAQSAALDKQFAQMPTTFSQATTVMGNDISQLMDYLSQPGQAVDVIIHKIEDLTAYLNTPQGTAMLQNIAIGLTTAANILSWFFGLAVNTYNFIATNWSWLGPIFLGIAVAVGILAAAVLVYNGIQAVSTFIEMFSIAVKAIHTGSTLAQAAALQTATGAQVGLNVAMLASPVTWIIAAIILFIVIIYAGVGAINHFTGAGISATGLICGAVALAVAYIGNNLIAMYNLIIDGIAVIYNGWATFAEFFKNVFDDPIGSIIRLFSGMADTVLGILKGIASAIDTIFGSHLADAVSGWQGNLQGWTDQVAGKAKIQVPRMDTSSMHIQQRLDYVDWWKTGYSVGKGIDSKVGDAMSQITGFSDQLSKLQQSTPDMGKQLNYGDAYKHPVSSTPGKNTGSKGIQNPTGGKLDKVGAIGSAVDISDQSLQYLNDIATAQALDRLNAYQTVTYEEMNDLRLSPEDADALQASANKNTNIYYLNYSGKVNIQNDVKQGEDWESIKSQIHDQTESELETGLSGMDEVVYG